MQWNDCCDARAAYTEFTRPLVLTVEGLEEPFVWSPGARGLGGTLVEALEVFLVESSVVCLPSPWERLE